MQDKVWSFSGTFTENGQRILGGQSPTVQIPLNLFTTEIAQIIELQYVLHPFGNHMQFEPFCHHSNGINNAGRVLFLFNLTDRSSGY